MQISLRFMRFSGGLYSIMSARTSETHCGCSSVLCCRCRCHCSSLISRTLFMRLPLTDWLAGGALRERLRGSGWLSTGETVAVSDFSLAAHPVNFRFPSSLAALWSAI